jgi:aminoglycoside phosphotransferase (APT) family kinase protein
MTTRQAPGLRPAEAGDAAARAGLADWFAPRWAEAFGSSAEPVEVTRLERLSKGQSSDLLDISCRRGALNADYIVRCQPRSRQLFLKPDVLREARVLQGLAGRVPAPRVCWTEPSDTLLGAPFFVMEKIDGRPMLSKPSIHLDGLLPQAAEPNRRLMWETALQALVAIHAVDWRATHAFLAPADVGRGYLSDHLAQLGDWYAWTTGGRSFPITDAALDYLRREQTAIDDSDPVLVWNDARPGNMLFGADHRLAAVIDWEMPLIGPAGVDVGYWVMQDEFHAEAIGVARLPGWPSQAEALARYATLSGRGVDNIDYFVVLAAFFIATTVIRQADLAIAGGDIAAASRMGHDNTLTQMIARRLDLPTPPISADFARHRRMAGHLAPEGR